MNHFIHIKHMIESHLYQFNKDNNKLNKRITLLVHLQRNKKLNEQFPLIFSKLSKVVFLDSLSQTFPLELDKFANESIKDICEQRGIKLLQNTFQRAFSHLDFDGKIDVENELQKLANLLSHNNKDSPVQKLLFDRFLKLLSTDKINRNAAEIVCESISNNPTWIRGSFYERLNDIVDKIGVVAMISVLRTLYTNFNVNISLQKDDGINKIFVQLYSLFNLIEDSPLDKSIESIIEERP
eukprot:187099_1